MYITERLVVKAENSQSYLRWQFLVTSLINVVRNATYTPHQNYNTQDTNVEGLGSFETNLNFTAVFSALKPYTLVGGYRSFERMYRFYLQFLLVQEIV
jgi:hypothetical protein